MHAFTIFPECALRLARSFSRPPRIRKPCSSEVPNRLIIPALGIGVRLPSEVHRDSSSSVSLTGLVRRGGKTGIREPSAKLSAINASFVSGHDWGTCDLSRGCPLDLNRRSWL